MQSIHKIYNRTQTALLTLLLCLVTLHAGAQNEDARRLCTEAAQGLLAEDAPAYIENCVSDYNVNMGGQADAQIDEHTADDESISAPDMTDNDQVDNATDSFKDNADNSADESSESYLEDDPQLQD